MVPVEAWSSQGYAADSNVKQPRETGFNSSLPGLTRQSIFFERDLCEDGWMPGSSPGMTTVGIDIVIASEAKQSIGPHKERMDCFAALAMTVKHKSAFSLRNPPEFCYGRPALCSEGAGNAGRWCARSRACSGSKHAR
jgi:hypothetical protein